MRLHWARGVFDFVFSTHRAFVIRANVLTKVWQTLLAQGKGEDEAGRRAGLGGIIDGQKVGTRDEGTTFWTATLPNSIGEAGLKPKHCKNRDSGGLVGKD